MKPTNPNPYAPPLDTGQHDPEAGRPIDIDEQLAETRLTFLARAATVSSAVAGALLLFCGLQIWGVVGLAGIIRVVPWLMLLLGVFQVVVSVKIYRQRVWAVVLSMILSGAIALATILWFLVATASGFISLLALVTPFTELIAAIMAGLAIPSCRRVAAARRRLAAEGLDVDF